jgi:hypothetical protein
MYNYFLLFADDIVWLHQFKKNTNTAKHIEGILKKLEVWLGKWRLKMAAEKCSHLIIDGKVSLKPELLKPQLYQSLIPYERASRFLGLTIDGNLNFNDEIARIKERAQKRINILRILTKQYGGG